MDTKDLPFQKKELKVIVHNPDNLHTVAYKKLKILQGDLKTLSKENKEKLYNSIKTYGYFLPAFVWPSEGDLFILDATQRYHVLSEFEANGYEVPEIPYVTIEAKDKKDAAQKLLQITSSYGEINPETSFFQDFNIDLDYVNDIAIPELELAFEGLESEEIIEDEVPEVPEAHVTQVGDLWLCGKHRVLCGDATKAEDVERLMDGKKADVIFTDPPYGVGKDFENDKLESREEFNKSWLSVIKETTKAGILIWYKPAAIDQIIIPARDIGLKQVDYLHLYKPNDVAFTRYSWLRISESMIVLANGNKIEYNEIKPYAHDTYLWNHTAKDKSFCHPSVKPIEVVMDVMSRFQASIIADFFLGSGTTLIAAQQLNRICYGIEIEPRYVDVTLERYANLTGIDPVREDGKKWSELKTI